MNRTELVSKCAEKLNKNQKDVKECLDAALDIIIENVLAGNKVELSCFGSFSLVDRAQRQCRNPMTGEKMTIPARKVVKFKPYSGMRME